MSQGLRIEVLGSLRVVRSGDTVTLGGRIQQKVLALLVSSPNAAISDDLLIEEVWAGEPPASARHLIQVYVSRLREVLSSGGGGPLIHRDGSGYTLDIPPGQLDSLLFTHAVGEADTIGGEDPEGAAQILEEALSMWRGRPFGDLGDEMPTVRIEADRLEEVYLNAYEDRIDAGLRIGRHHELIPVLGELTEKYPLRERLWGQLMLGLYRSGREAEALRTYSRLGRLLGEELGTEPSAELRHLEEQILLQDPELTLAPPPPPSNLPVQLTSFVGREAELAELAERIAEARLVALTGPGGIGKSRLAAAAAEAVLDDFPGGVWWIDLSPIDDPTLIPARIAAVLGVGGHPDRTLVQSMVAALSLRQMLVVLDNCEQLAAGVGSIIADLLAGCARLKILATSRVALDVAGEVRWEVPALVQPEPDEAPEVETALTADAIRLFAERAGAADRTFQLDSSNVVAVTNLCRRLDGLPLAIEMAAAQVARSDPGEILESLTDRFALLRGPRFPELPRHETLQAALDWSRDLLPPDLQHAFDAVAVFAGQFDVEAASAVTAGYGISVALALDELGSASLLSERPNPAGEVRYRLLETVRDYGRHRLAERGEMEELRDRHGAHYLGVLARASDALFTPDFAEWLSRFEESYDDIRSALEWSLPHRLEMLPVESMPILSEFWYRSARAEEAGLWGRSVLQGAGAPSRVQAAAHNAVAFSDTIRGDLAGSIEHAEAAAGMFREADDRRGLAGALFTRAQAALASGDFETMFTCGVESLAIIDEIGSRWERARPLTVLAFAEWFGRGNLTRAAELAAETLPLYRELGDRTSEVVFALTPLCSISLQQGDVTAAEAYARAAVAVSDYWSGSALSSLGDALAAKGESVAAESAYRRGLSRSLEAGLDNWFRVNIRKLAAFAAQRGDHTEAARLWGASEVNMPQWGAAIGQAEAAAVRTSLGDDQFNQLAAEGSSWTDADVAARIRRRAVPE